LSLGRTDTAAATRRNARYPRVVSADGEYRHSLGGVRAHAPTRALIRPLGHGPQPLPGPCTLSPTTECTAQAAPECCPRLSGMDRRRLSGRTASRPTTRPRRSERTRSPVAQYPMPRPRPRNSGSGVLAGVDRRRQRLSSHRADPTTGCLLETSCASRLSRWRNSWAISSAATSVARHSSSAAAIPSTGSEDQ